MTRFAKSLIILAVVAGSLRADLTNGGFEKGQKGPEGWQLVGSGQWSTIAHSGHRAIAVVGRPQASDYWRTAPLSLRPRALYRFSFWARADKTSGGCIISGPNFCNRDFRLHTRWERRSFVFATPDDPTGAFVRLGHWHAAATVWFDDAALRPVVPFHVVRDGLELGAGEEIDGTAYTFTTTLNGEGCNFARTLHDFNCGFNRRGNSQRRSKSTATTTSGARASLRRAAMGRSGRAWEHSRRSAAFASMRQPRSSPPRSSFSGSARSATRTSRSTTSATRLASRGRGASWSARRPSSRSPERT